ncbi:craniofacial development protein 2-like [Ostrea edulis]|uniref:craniofacial development protein 2-like n=1 Tax=Ostrea edulis TaxID=37623 RepID=UPI0024AEDA04|nr:craniofacial development protein 2-like [Ostrea edulis]
MRVNSGHTILYSGHDDKHQSEVAIMISKEKIKTLLEWEPINDRLIRARFNSTYCKLTIIQCYAPTNDAEEEIKDYFYEQLQMVVSKVPQHDMMLMIGDLNAKVGADNTDCKRSMGKHGCGIRNDNGERLIDFCLNNNLVIGGTIFPHKDIHKLTWKSPDEKDKEAKRSARKDKRMHLDNLAKRAEHAASHGEMSVVYKITKQLCGKNTTQPALVKDKDGHPLSTDHEQAKSTADKKRGIQWTMFSNLEDLDFADDLAEISGNKTHLQEKTDQLCQTNWS